MTSWRSLGVGRRQVGWSHVTCHARAMARAMPDLLVSQLGVYKYPSLDPAGFSVRPTSAVLMV